MNFYLMTTNCEYDMNNPNGRATLRQHLMQQGFFEYPENKPLWGVFDLPKADGEIAKTIHQAMTLFDYVHIGKNRRVDDNQRHTNQ